MNEWIDWLDDSSDRWLIPVCMGTLLCVAIAILVAAFSPLPGICP